MLKGESDGEGLRLDFLLSMTTNLPQSQSLGPTLPSSRISPPTPFLPQARSLLVFPCIFARSSG